MLSDENVGFVRIPVLVLFEYRVLFQQSFSTFASSLSTEVPQKTNDLDPDWKHLALIGEAADCDVNMAARIAFFLL